MEEYEQNNRSNSKAGRISNTFQSLENIQFRYLWFGMLFSQAAMQINIVAWPWLAYSISGSALSLGLVELSRGLPNSIFSLFAGALADRGSKRTLLIMVQFTLAGLAIVSAMLIHLKVIRIWHLAVIALLRGIISAFNAPARQALIPKIVGSDLLPNALALGSASINLNRVIAPSIAGILIAFSPALAFDVVAILYVVSGLLLLLLQKTEDLKTSKESNVFKDIVDGFYYIFGNRKIIIILLMGLIPTIIWRPFTQLLPVFQQTVLNVSPSALGIMYTVIGIGALTGSLAVASLPSSADRHLIQGVAGVLIGTFLTAFAASSIFPLSLIYLTFVGIIGQGYMTINSVFLMETSDPAYYGRVMSVYLLNFSMAPIAMLPTGYLVDRYGVSATEMAAGIMLTIAMLIFLGLRRRLVLPEITGND